MTLMRLCICGKVIPDSIPRCEECQVRYDMDTKERNRLYNRHNRDRDIQAIYSNRRWIIARRQAKHRDNGLCLICLKGYTITYYQAVHHIIPLEDDLSKAFEIKNLICLCESCHQLIHVEYNKSAKSKKEAQRFLFGLIKSKE